MMSVRIERPVYLAQPRAARAPGGQAEDRPGSAREGEMSRAKRYASRSIRHTRSAKTIAPAWRQAAELSSLVSLNQNIDWVIMLATSISGTAEARKRET